MKSMLVMWVGAVLAMGSVQPERPGVPDGASARVADRWGSRLERLEPRDPAGYFLLGEEVAAEAGDGDARELARRLYVLAYELDARAGGSEKSRLGFPLAPSACLGLAAIATKDDERRWLRALADTLAEGPMGAAAPRRGRGHEWPQEAATALAKGMGLARSGDGRLAMQFLEKPGVDELVRDIDSRPMPDGRPAILRNFLDRAVRDWPACPQCRNRRVVPAGASRTGEMVLCDTCRGNPGPRLTDDELSNQLRIEAMLLEGEQRSWAAQVLADAGAPLRDLDPSELAGTYGVDPALTVWRAGVWTAPGAGRE